MEKKAKIRIGIFVVIGILIFVGFHIYSNKFSYIKSSGLAAWESAEKQDDGKIVFNKPTMTDSKLTGGTGTAKPFCEMIGMTYFSHEDGDCTADRTIKETEVTLAGEHIKTEYNTYCSEKTVTKVTCY